MKYTKVKGLYNKRVDTFIEKLRTKYNIRTPINVLFTKTFVENIEKFKAIYEKHSMSPNLYFACKANKSDLFIKSAIENDCGVEVSSAYELAAVVKAGGSKIIVSGPAKSKSYLTKALEHKCIIAVDDIFELNLLKTISMKQNDDINILIRISDISDEKSRFGIEISHISECLNLIKNTNINLLGFSFHINSYNITDRINGIDKIIKVIRYFKATIKFIDIGGGFPMSYCDEQDWLNFIKNNNPDRYFANRKLANFYTYYSSPSSEKCLDQIMQKTISKLKQNNIELIIEPGRSLLNQCGITIFKIEYLKQMKDDNIIITNGNINFLSEQWFNSDFVIEPIHIPKNGQKKLENEIYCSVAGNLCLEQDMLTWRKIGFEYMPMNGDLLIYTNTAGYQMDSNESTFHRIPVAKKIEEKEAFKNDI